MLFHAIQFCGLLVALYWQCLADTIGYFDAVREALQGCAEAADPLGEVCGGMLHELVCVTRFLDLVLLFPWDALDQRVCRIPQRKSELCVK